MKKVIFIIAMAIAVANVYAQQPAVKKPQQGKVLSAEEKATKITNRLKTELSLTDEQTPKVKQSTLTRINQVSTAKTTAGSNQKAFNQERKKIFQNWETEMKGILTPEQYTTYLAKKEEKKKQIQENKAVKKAGSAVEEAEDELE